MTTTARADGAVPGGMEGSEVVTIATLVASELSPRQGALDARHVRALQEVLDLVPPIVVHRDTMAVIDGAHRLEAMRQSGWTEVGVIFFDGSELDAFVLAIQANATHGRPLSFDERKGAARALLSRFPERSTRWIASICGLSSATVAGIRPVSGRAEKRVGVDGRTRPVDPTEIRSTIAERLDADPDASAREVASDVGASPSTVRRIMEHRSHAGDDHFANGNGAVEKPLAAEAKANQLALWLTATAVPEDQGLELVAKLPATELAPAADEFRRRAEYWGHLADLAAERARS